MGVNGIYGLSGSGLDIESLVKVGMMSKQNEYDKMAQKFTKNEWTKAAYVELNSQINTFNMTKLIDYKLSSNMKAKTAESSNAAAVTATANGNAVAMPHRVDVDQLSTNAYLISNNKLGDIITGNDNAETDKRYLKDMFATSAVTVDPIVNVNYSGATNGLIFSPNGGAQTGLEITRGTDGAINNLKYKAVGGTLTDKGTVNYDSTVETATYNISDSTAFSLTSTTTDSTTFTFSADGKEYTGGIKGATDGKITFDGVENADGSTSVRTLTANTTNNQSTLTITDTTTFAKGTASTEGNVTTYTFTNDSGSETAITLTYESGKYSISGAGIAASNFTATSSGSELKFQVTTADGATQTLTFTPGDDNASLKIENTKTYSNVATSSVKEETVTAGNVTAVVTTNTDTSGNKTYSATTNATESGYAGISVNSNSADFRAGKSASFITNGEQNAIEFTIGDGKKTADVAITFAELYGEGMLTINDLVSKINKAASANDLNIKATYESLSDRFFLYNSESGSEDKIEITIGTSDIKDNSNAVVGNTGTLAETFFNSLGLAQTKDGALSTTTAQITGGKMSVAGEDGIARIDGVEYRFQDNKLDVSSLGITYNFNQTTTTGYGTDNKIDNPVTVTVGQDTESIVNRVKTFIEDYNKILGDLYAKYDEKSDSNYKPLTQAQKDSMKEEQITKWEEKAKAGLLYHDQTLSKIINDMRSAITNSVELDDGTKVSIFSLGVSTTGIKGQLTLDEDKLKKALGNDPDIVYNVFGTLNNNTGKTSSEYQGVAQRLGDVFASATKAIKSRAGSSTDITEDSELNNLLRELQTKMSNFKKLMSSFEDRLYKKYDAMESALSKLGMQLNFITGAQQ